MSIICLTLLLNGNHFFHAILDTKLFTYLPFIFPVLVRARDILALC